MPTQLNYDIVPDKSPLYTTVDQLNQSTADLQVSVTNAGSAPVTIKVIEIELKKVFQGLDSVQLLLPGGEGGIECPISLTGPGGANWKITKNDGEFTLKPTPVGSSVTFQPRDTFSLTLKNVVIREGGDGTALVHVIEESDAGREEAPVGIGITQSTLDVTLSTRNTLIEPGQAVTLEWETNDATSGVLTMPGSSPDTMTLDSTNLSRGQKTVTPIENTTYSLTCQGRGPEVMGQVGVTIKKVEVRDFSPSAPEFGVTETLELQWQTIYATECTLSAKEGSGSVKVPVLNSETTVCHVAATPDGQTLIVTSAAGSNQELGRLSLSTPCPDSVSFLLWVKGAPRPKQASCTVKLLRPEIQFNRNLQTEDQDAGDPGENMIRGGGRFHRIKMYRLSLSWDVKYASSVQVKIDGQQISSEARGEWQQNDWSENESSAAISCIGFGGTITQ